MSHLEVLANADTVTVPPCVKAAYLHWCSVNHTRDLGKLNWFFH